VCPSAARTRSRSNGLGISPGDDYSLERLEESGEPASGEKALYAVRSPDLSALEMPSTRPETLLACTATYGLEVRTAKVVSKPRQGADPTGSSWLGSGPASACQVATSVAPFQLT